MNQQLITIMIAATVGGMLSMDQLAAQISPTTPRAARVRILQGPESDQANDYLTIIRWTTNNPGGSPVHYGVVHYGSDPKDLNQTAESPIRLNPGHSETIFRVRIQGLKAGVTYYYTVESKGADDTSDGVKSTMKQFTVGPQPGGASRPLNSQVPSKK
jgi:Purple acid Phosphatase, N-terminal domain